MLSRYWTLYSPDSVPREELIYPKDKPVWDPLPVIAQLETLTRNQIMMLIVIWWLVYQLINRYLVPLAYAFFSGYLTYQLFVYQQQISDFFLKKS